MVVDVLVFVYGLRAWRANICDQKQESQGENKEFGNPGRRGSQCPAEACLQFHHLLFSMVVVLMSTSKTITVQRIDLSLGLTQLFCENSDYETLRLINGGINLEKKTAIEILQVICASQG